ncbi:MAG TPA: glycosyltransferase, partial [Candidatus Saccharimonadales bacterium]|nr:glycosyltransferase [Candidatus Saccharimonadales bacterium]
MRIGIFTDSFVPRPDGIAIAVDTMRQALEQEGHEVYVFCPARPEAIYDDPHIITYPSVPAFFYEGLRAAWPFGRRKLQEIEELRLDIIHIHLPFMIGFAGLRAAKKLSIPVVMSCHQDMDYVKDYPGAFLLGGLILLPVMLITGRFRQAGRLLFARRVDKRLPWRYDLVRRSYTFLTDSCDAAVAPSHKIFDQLKPYSKS